MTFTTSLKEEIAKHEINSIESRYELMAFLNSVAKFNKDEISLTLENASIARRIYKEIKEIKIQKEVVDPDDVEMLQDLILGCVNEALRKVDSAQAAQLGKYNIPGIM